VLTQAYSVFAHENFNTSLKHIKELPQKISSQTIVKVGPYFL